MDADGVPTLLGRGPRPKATTYGSSLNYAVPGVRDYLFSIMEEVAHRFDIDGIEFNFTRLVECFPRAEAAQSHPLMTDFVRRVRAMLDEAGTMSISPMPLDRPGYPPPVDRDRRLLLGVRVPQQLAGCAAWGLNVPTWIEEGLVDYVAPADFGFTDFNESYEDFTRLARGHDCYVYPQVQTKLGIDADIDMEPARYRAAVRNFYAAGADGLSTQNYFFHWLPQFESPGEDGPAIPEEYPRGFNYLKELRDPDEIATGDRHYVFLLLWADLNDGHGMSHIYQPQRIVLERGPAEARGNYRFRVCEHFPADPILPLTTEGSGLSFFTKRTRQRRSAGDRHQRHRRPLGAGELDLERGGAAQLQGRAVESPVPLRQQRSRPHARTGCRWGRRRHRRRAAGMHGPSDGGRLRCPQKIAPP